jgi:hypothetical protein
MAVIPDEKDKRLEEIQSRYPKLPEGAYTMKRDEGDIRYLLGKIGELRELVRVKDEALKRISEAFKALESGDYEGYCDHEVGVCFMQSKELHEAITEIEERTDEAKETP